MPSLKVFVGSSVDIPRAWLDTLDVPFHHPTAEMAAVAGAKADLVPLARERGLPFGERHLTAIRLVRPRGYCDDLRLLIDAGLLGDRPDILLWHRGVKDKPIARPGEDGALRVVAHFRYEPGWQGRGLYVEHAGA